MKFKKTMQMALAVALVSAFTNLVAAAEAPVLEAQGTIHAVELEANSLVIDGVRFNVAFDAQVEIRGSYGAFGFLQAGMKVVFEYRRYSPSNLVIFDIEQLPDNADLEET
ncbi:MAG: hypothetical protein O7G86_11600 [Gammaproteobacteria bacterium]|nr:hypothetical protein [Gammaproteobacteria bacterium]